MSEQTVPNDIQVDTLKSSQTSGEFERESVPENSLRSWLSFLAVFAGRHTAGTEFSIGPLYIVHGAKASDVLLGLFIGDLLAVLSWRFICAPVAVKKTVHNLLPFGTNLW